MGESGPARRRCPTLTRVWSPLRSQTRRWLRDESTRRRRRPPGAECSHAASGSTRRRVHALRSHAGLVAHSDGERKQAQRRVDVPYAAAPFSIELSSLVGEGELSAGAGVQDQLSVDLLTAERDTDCGPLADELERTGRRERPHPLSLMPTSGSGKAVRPAVHRWPPPPSPPFIMTGASGGVSTSGGAGGKPLIFVALRPSENCTPISRASSGSLRPVREGESVGPDRTASDPAGLPRPGPERLRPTLRTQTPRGTPLGE
jgi:hypothetical protein